MIQKLMMKLGYAKIPSDVVKLSFYQEQFLKRLHDNWEGDAKELICEHWQNQVALTAFLREGKRITEVA